MRIEHWVWQQEGDCRPKWEWFQKSRGDESWNGVGSGKKGGEGIKKYSNLKFSCERNKAKKKFLMRAKGTVIQSMGIMVHRGWSEDRFSIWTGRKIGKHVVHMPNEHQFSSIIRKKVIRLKKKDVLFFLVLPNSISHEFSIFAHEYFLLAPVFRSLDRRFLPILY